MAVDLPLQDIHLPAAVDSWPLAPGWWLLLVLLLAAMLGGWRCWQRRRLQRLALARLNALARRPSDPHLAAALSRLLRQTVISHFPPDKAGLTGQRWLDFLDHPFSDRPFSTGAGRCLLDAPYRVDTRIDGEALIGLCRRWLKKLPPQPVRRRRGR